MREIVMKRTSSYSRADFIPSARIILAAAFLLITACQRVPEKMVAIPAGDFIMGSNEEDRDEKSAEYGIMKPWFKDENPERRVHLPLYYLDQYEITNSDYRTFIQDTGRRPPPDWANGQFPPNRGRHPVIHVAWEDANAYCLWAGKRLPTEAEWEKAARGPNGPIYPWGDSFDPARANLNDQVGNTTEVGQYETGKSPYGVYDMIGNVWEWTADWYKPYPGSSDTSDSFGERFKVIRGNSWAGIGHYPREVYNEIKMHNSRASFRLFLAPTGFVNDLGFRCAKSAG